MEAVNHVCITSQKIFPILTKYNPQFHTADNALLTSKLSIIHLALLSPFAACVTTSVSLWKMTENGPWSLSGFCRSSCGQDNIWLLEYMDIDMCNEWVTFIPENIKQVCVMVLRMKQRYPWSSGYEMNTRYIRMPVNEYRYDMGKRQRHKEI